jgi:hypothetical protein
MTLDREKSMAAIDRQRLEMNADSAIARAAIRSEAAVARAELDKRIALIEARIKP